MKKLLFTVLGFVALNLVASAQLDREQNTNGTVSDSSMQRRGGNKGDRKAKMQKMKAMVKELGLSKEQMRQMKDLNISTKQQLQALKADQTLTKEQKKEKLVAVKTSREEKLKTILTPEQYAKLKEKMKANGVERKGKKNSAVTAGDDDMLSELDEL
jgi:Spy/CpxP family protein refolding chaperone